MRSTSKLMLLSSCSRSGQPCHRAQAYKLELEPTQDDCREHANEHSLSSKALQMMNVFTTKQSSSLLCLHFAAAFVHSDDQVSAAAVTLCVARLLSVSQQHLSIAPAVLVAV